MKHFRALSVLAAIATVGCFPERIIAPDCAPTDSSTASTSGDTITTTTGLRYINIVGGPGPAVAWCTNITIHYEAYLADGTKFDDSRVSDIPLVFTPGTGSLIDGIEQGVVGMRGGARRVLIIPPALGFGSTDRRNEQGQVIVPANSTVIYEVEVVQVGLPVGQPTT